MVSQILIEVKVRIYVETDMALQQCFKIIAKL